MKKNLYLKAVLLGLSTSFLWSFQHPLQHPLYLSMSSANGGRLAVVLLAELAAAAFYLLLLFKGGVRRNILRAVETREYLKPYVISISASFAGLLIYANSQSNLSGLTVSLIITLSPLVALMSGIYVSGGNVWMAVREGVRTREFSVHLLVILAVILVVTLQVVGGGDPHLSFRSISYWLYEKGATASATLLVPLLYFISASAIARPFHPKGANTHLAAVLVNSLLSAAISFLLIGLYFYFRSSSLLGILLNFNSFDFLSFLVGAFAAGFLGTLTLHLSYRLPGDERKITSITYHTVPLFSAMVGYVMWLVSQEPRDSPDGVHYTSSIAVAIVAAVFYRGELFIRNWKV